MRYGLWVLAMAMAVTGCLDSDTPRCGDTYCPPPLVCRADNVCSRADLLAACDGVGDGDECMTDDGLSGICVDGSCDLHTCGDGRKGKSEACDGDDLGEYSCQSFGFYDATGLVCTADCGFDVTGCTGTCGDGEQNGAELCDGEELGGRTCQTFGFYYPEGLACQPDACAFDVSGCSGQCGDGTHDIDFEYCDPTPPNGDYCTTFGFGAGRLGCSSSCSPDFERCHHLRWRSLATSTLIDLHHVLPLEDGEGRSHLIAVGEGASVHYDGLNWTKHPFDDVIAIKGRAVWGTAPDDLWAATLYGPSNAGVVMRFDGQSWSPAGSPTVTGGLYDIWGTSNSDVWAVGHGGTILHWDGSQWSQTTVGTDRFLRVGGPDPSNPNLVYALSWYNLYRFEGSSWTPVVATTDPNDYRDLWFDPAGNVYASRNLLAPARLVADAWMPLGPSSRVGFDQAVAPSAGRLVGTAAGQLAIYDGALQSSFASPSLQRVSRDGLRVYVAAAQGLIMTADSVAFSGPLVTGAGVAGVEGAWASDQGAMFVVGDSGGVARYATDQDPLGWASLSPGTGANLEDVWGFAEDDLFVVGRSGAMRHYQGADVWQTITVDTATDDLMTVWGRSASDVYVGARHGGRIYHYAGGATSSVAHTSTLGSVYAIDGTANRVVAVGHQGKAAIEADGTWTDYDTGVGPRDLRAVCAISDQNVWAFGDQGAAAHFDGSSWTAVELPTLTSFDECIAYGPDDVLALGAEIWRWDGQRFTPMTKPFDQTVKAAARTGSGVFMAPSSNLEAVHLARAFAL